VNEHVPVVPLLRLQACCYCWQTCNFADSLAWFIPRKDSKSAAVISLLGITELSRTHRLLASALVPLIGSITGCKMISPKTCLATRWWLRCEVVLTEPTELASRTQTSVPHVDDG